MKEGSREEYLAFVATNEWKRTLHFFKTGSCYVDHTSLKLKASLPQPPASYWIIDSMHHQTQRICVACLTKTSCIPVDVQVPRGCPVTPPTTAPQLLAPHIVSSVRQLSLMPEEGTKLHQVPAAKETHAGQCVPLCELTAEGNLSASSLP